MCIIDFIAVVCFGLTCFSIGYTLGKDNHKPQKELPWSGKLSGYKLVAKTHRLAYGMKAT